MLPASDKIVLISYTNCLDSIRPNKMFGQILILIVYILTNSADPDEMPPNVASHLGDSLQKMSVLYAGCNERVCRLTCYMLVTTFVIC